MCKTTTLITLVDESDVIISKQREGTCFNKIGTITLICLHGSRLLQALWSVYCSKNMGEEISLRLRTDDLKGFRKYESIKKTLLLELAHMVHSEHDANLFALNKQLNEEAASMNLILMVVVMKLRNMETQWNWIELVIDGKHGEEPDPDDTACQDVLKSGNGTEMITKQSRNSMVLKAEPDPDDHVGDSNINELQRVEEPVRALCSRLQESIEMLLLQAAPEEAESAIQSLITL